MPYSGEPSPESSLSIPKTSSRGQGKGKEKEKDVNIGKAIKVSSGRSVIGSPTNLLVLLGLGIAGLVVFVRSRKKKISEDFDAFIERLEILPPPQPAPPIAPHPLSGLTFAVKDM